MQARPPPYHADHLGKALIVAHTLVSSPTSWTPMVHDLPNLRPITTTYISQASNHYAYALVLVAFPPLLAVTPQLHEKPPSSTQDCSSLGHHQATMHVASVSVCHGAIHTILGPRTMSCRCTASTPPCFPVWSSVPNPAAPPSPLSITTWPSPMDAAAKDMHRTIALSCVCGYVRTRSSHTEEKALRRRLPGSRTDVQWSAPAVARYSGERGVRGPVVVGVCCLHVSPPRDDVGLFFISALHCTLS